MKAFLSRRHQVKYKGLVGHVRAVSPDAYVFDVEGWIEDSRTFPSEAEALYALCLRLQALRGIKPTELRVYD